MSDKHRQAIVIEAGDKNTVEQFINSLRKKADKGQVEFGVDLTVTRVDLEGHDIDGFSD